MTEWSEAMYQVLVDLADLDPLVEVMTDYDASELRCALCREVDAHTLLGHAPGCPWRRACEFTVGLAGGER